MIQFQQKPLTVFQSALYQTTCAIIETEKALIMTDPNWLPAEVQSIQQYIEQKLGNRTLYIIFTHSDFDHIIAAGAFPQAITIASEAFVKRIDKERVLDEIYDFDAQYYIARDYPIVYPTINIVITEDGQEALLGDVLCRFYFAPGHTEDSLFTFVEGHGIFLAGDYLSNVEFPLLSHYDAYVKTLAKAQQLIEQTNVLVPGHGQTTASREEMNKRLQESQHYLLQLKEHVDQEAYLTERYPFYRSLKQLHDDNKKVL